MASSIEQTTANRLASPPDSAFGVEDSEWNPDKPEESLQRLYERDVGFAKDKIRWYYNEAEDNGRRAKRIRLLVICLLTLGALCPSVDATGLVAELRLTAWGYVFFGLAAGLFAIDRFYGLSTSWARNTTTWLAIRNTLVAFQHDWVLSQGVEHVDIRQQIEALKQFRQKIGDAVVEETAVWTAQEEQARKALLQDIDQGSRPGR